jgi:hypothetical protein
LGQAPPPEEAKTLNRIRNYGARLICSSTLTPGPVNSVVRLDQTKRSVISMHKHHGLLELFCPIVLLSCTSAALAQNRDEAVFVGSSPPKELKVLEPLIGQWTIEVRVKPSLAVKEGFTSKGEAACRWIHNGHYLLLEGFSDAASGRFEWTEIITYDQRSGQFRRFVFSTEGIVAESVGKWDAKTQTMTWTVVSLPDRWSGTATTRLDNDTVDITLLVMNDRGQKTRDSSMIMQRKE